MIRNSTAEFLIFQTQSKEESIEVKYFDETVWLTQTMIAKLFDKGRSTITEHLSEIFKSGELDENLVCREFRQTASDGKSYKTKFYNLDAIISVGYRVNSKRATLKNAGKITQRIAKEHAESEFEKYRITPDRLFQLDFDKFVKNDDRIIEHKNS